MWVCNICLDIDRRVASFAKPMCHMACAGTSHKCPLSYPSLVAFDYLAVAVPFPSCHYFWQIIIKMTLSQCELLSHGQENQAQTHRVHRHRTHTHTSNCTMFTHNTHRTMLTVWAELCGDWNVRINGYLYFIRFLYRPQNNVSLSGRYWNICQPLSTHRCNSIWLFKCTQIKFCYCLKRPTNIRKQFHIYQIFGQV